MNNELIPQPSWWKRNWKWVIPLGGCLSMIVIGLIFVFSLIYGISSDLEEKEPFRYAFEVINKDEEMIRHLGTPIVQNGIFQGDMSCSPLDQLQT